jgi:hypothetical protein
MAQDNTQQQPSEPGSDPAQADSSKEYLEGPSAWLLGICLVAVSLLVLYVMVKLWPADVNKIVAADEALFFGWIELKALAPEVRILLLVLCGGAIGGLVHMLQSFAVFMGSRQLVSSWVFWYLTGPLKGALLGLVFYVLIRGGLLSGQGAENSLSVLGLTGASALVGLFSDQALDKLKQVFATMFATGAAARTDALVREAPQPAPEVTSVEPSQLKAGEETANLRLKGKNFASDAYVTVDGNLRSSSQGEDGSLVVTLLKADIASARDLRVQVVNKSSGSKSPEQLVKVA